MEKKEELIASLSATAAAEALAAGQAGSRSSVVRSQLKTHLTQPEKSVLQRGTLTFGDLGQAGAAPKRRGTPEAAEVEFPLISSHSPLWKVKMAAGWDEFGEWKYLTAFHGHSVERLREKFDRIDVKTVTLVARYVISDRQHARVLPLLPPPYRSPSLTAMACTASLLPKPVLALSPARRQSPMRDQQATSPGAQQGGFQRVDQPQPQYQ